MNPFIELRPGEPPFQMKLDPDDFITFKGETMTACPVDFDVNVTNTTKVRQACKVKCTSNAIFRAWPPHSFIQPGETLSIKLSLICSTIPDPSKHFFAFVHVAAPETEEKKTPKGFWTPNTKHDGIKRVAIQLLKPDGMPWTPDPEPKTAVIKPTTEKK